MATDVGTAGIGEITAGLGSIASPIASTVASVPNNFTLPTLPIKIFMLLGCAYSAWHYDTTKRGIYGSDTILSTGVKDGADHWTALLSQAIVSNQAAGYTVVPGIMLQKKISFFTGGTTIKQYFISFDSLAAITGAVVAGVSL